MRVVVIGPLASGLLHIRGPLLREMLSQGHEVMAIAPDEDEEARHGLERWGIDFRVAPIVRTGMNPVSDLRSLVWLTRTIRAFDADVVLTNSVKPVVYGLAGARLAGTRMRAAMITGAGSALTGAGSRGRRVLSAAVRGLYWVGLSQAQVVFFQNQDDEGLFRSLGLVRGCSMVERINGSGVDLQRYAETPLPDGPMTFLLIARLLRDKGLAEYVEAARIVRAAHPAVRCQVLGPLDTNPEAISAEQLDAWVAEGAIEYLGIAKDVRGPIARSHVAVLPSYREGMPRSILEAMAMGRAVISTDVPGCRETVIPGHSGYLVPARDARALAEAMLRMVEMSGSLPAMGRASRELAEQRFDVESVNRVILDSLGLRSVLGAAS